MGIHSYLYLHGSYVWDGTPPPGLGMGTLVAKHEELETIGGNAVLSYLDIVAPDEVSPRQVHVEWKRLLTIGEPPPKKKQVRRCSFEYNAVRALHSIWRREVLLLFSSAMALWTQEYPANRRRSDG